MIKVELALIEAGAQYTVHTIDLENKPAYFLEKINPVGKVRDLLWLLPLVPSHRMHRFQL